MKGSPLLGYNNNVRHKGKLYHIQTEDSGLKHPHVITHLFADGGRIISSKKSSYAEHVGSESCKQIVKKMMQEQHKAMFIALKAGEFDEDEAAPASVEIAIDTSPGVQEAPNTEERVVDVDALERAAARLAPGQKAASDRPALYQATRPTRTERRATPSEPSPESIFGKDLLSEKSLDEVILSYLAEDLEDTD